MAAPALGLWVGATVWVSLGTQAVVTADSASRIAALPPLWLLPVLALAGAVLAMALRPALAAAWPLSVAGLLWLPYLPGHIPSAFLLWQGPLEALVWLVVAAGMTPALPVTWPRLAAASGDPRRAPWLAAAVMAIASTWAFAAVRPVVPGGDEPHYLVITQSLMLDGDLRIENNHARGDYLSYFPGRLRPDFLERGADGEIYSVHAPGLSALLIPGFALAGYVGAVTTMVLAAAATSGLTWYVAWMLSASAAGAWTGWAAVFLTSPFLFHSFTLYPDAVGALLVMVGAWLIVRFEVGGRVSHTSLSAVGSALALLPWLHTRFSLFAGGLGLVLVGRIWQRPDRAKAIAALLAVPVMAGVAWFGFFWAFWGTISPSAPYGEQTNASLAYLAKGVPGLLFDQQFGLITTAPVYACAVAGWLWLARQRRRLAGELLFVLLPYVLMAATYAMWWGGTSAPARFLVALMPVAALPIAVWWPRGSRAGRALVLLLLLVSAGAVLPRALVDDGRLLYNSRTGFDLTLEWLSRSTDLAMALPSLHRGSVAAALSDTAVWIAAGAMVAALAWRAGSRITSPGVTWAGVSLAAAVATMGAATVVWARTGAEPVTPDRSKVAALAAFHPDWLTTTVRLRPIGRLTASEWLSSLDLVTTDRGVLPEGDSAMVRVARLPAGDYEVLATTGRTEGGELTATIGRNDPPIDRWQLVAPGARLRLPVTVSALTLRGDPSARALATGVRLRPAAVRTPANRDRRVAIRATRYGAARVFFFDERAYLEPTGFWTRADGVASLVMDADDPSQGLTLRLRAGAVATTIAIETGAWSRALSLQPGQEALVTLPPAGGGAAWPITLRSGPGFRPASVDPASDDVRQLAVWVEVP